MTHRAQTLDIVEETAAVADPRPSPPHPRGGRARGVLGPGPLIDLGLVHAELVRVVLTVDLHVDDPVPYPTEPSTGQVVLQEVAEIFDRPVVTERRSRP